MGMDARAEIRAVPPASGTSRVGTTLYVEANRDDLTMNRHLGSMDPAGSSSRLRGGLRGEISYLPFQLALSMIRQWLRVK